jgi:lon-related putative ATP-dependent protease
VPADGNPRPLPARALRWRCAPSRFRGDLAAEEATLVETIGQDEALESLRLGAELYGPGYNVFVAGLPGLGKSSLVTKLLEELTPQCALPLDRVYVHNFKDPERPRLLELPRGEGRALEREIDRAVGFVAESIRRLADDEAYARRREEVASRHREEERTALDAFEKTCHERGFAPGAVSVAGVAEPDVLLAVGDQRVPMADLDEAVRAGLVPAEREDEIRRAHAELRGEMGRALRRARAAAQSGQRKLEELERDAALRIVADLESELRARFPYPAVAAQLADAREHFVARFPAYSRALLEVAAAAGGRADALRLASEEVFREFRVNVVLDAFATKSCPLVVEERPAWTNLFGQIEKDVDPRGAVRTDFRLIRAGSLLRADGGYLVLQARDVFAEEGAWEELKRVLRHRRLEIRVPEAMLAAVPTVLRPDPIPVNVKVVLIGDEGMWHQLREADPDFAEIFKVKATFEADTRLDDGALRRYASFFHKLATEEGLPHLDRGGLAALAEEGVREAGRQGRLSLRFGSLSDLVREAAYVARRHGADRVGAAHVREAVAGQARRAGVLERRVREAVREGLILVQTTGTRVGQVNGLAVYDFGDHRFGKVARITAAVGAGVAGIVNVERLAELSGAIHDKGVMILAGYLRSTFGAERPLAITASLVFEQSYGGVEGDSATCAEVFAVLSALSGLPVRQDLAVTGSMNQLGDVQAVGGVNDKVEGFYDLCAERGLTGTQGVLIPRANARDLMLRPDVVAACAAGRFAVYPIDRVEQGMGLLTGRRSGGTEAPGRFRRGGAYALAAERLSRLADLAEKAGRCPPGP